MNLIQGEWNNSTAKSMSYAKTLASYWGYFVDGCQKWPCYVLVRTKKLKYSPWERPVGIFEEKYFIYWFNMNFCVESTSAVCQAVFPQIVKFKWLSLDIFNSFFCHFHIQFISLEPLIYINICEMHGFGNLRHDNYQSNSVCNQEIAGSSPIRGVLFSTS